MAIRSILLPWESQPQEAVQLADWVPAGTMAVIGGQHNIVGGAYAASGVVSTTQTQQGRAFSVASGAYINLGRVPRGTAGALSLLAWIIPRTTAEQRYVCGTVDTGASYLEQVLLNSDPTAAFSAGNVLFSIRQDGGSTLAIRSAATSSPILSSGVPVCVICRFISPTEFEIWANGTKQAITYGNTGSPAPSAGLTEFGYDALSVNGRGTHGNGSNVDLLAFARIPSVTFDAAAVSRNPLLLFASRRIWVPAAAASTHRTAATSLTAIVQQGRAGSASLGAAVRRAHAVGADLDAALRQARTADTALQAAVQARGTGSAELAAAVQLAGAATAALGLAVQAARSTQASIAAAVERGGLASAGLDAMVQGGSSAHVVLGAAVLRQALAEAGLDAAVGARSEASTGLAAAVALARDAVSALDAAVAMGRSASVRLDAYLQGGATRVAALDAAVLAAHSAGTALQAAIARAGSSTTALGAVLAQRLQTYAAIGGAVRAARVHGAALSAYVLADGPGPARPVSRTRRVPYPALDREVTPNFSARRITP